jgi:MerR family Zn(II)-responsive transcriptional regulator of zntA
MMKISQLSAHSGLSAHTLRFYEKNGLIEASGRSSSGYRSYSEDDVRRVEFVKTARDAGFSLDEISQLLSIRLDRDQHTCEEVTAITRHKLDAVSAKIAQLEEIRQSLELLLKSCDGGLDSAEHCSIIEALDEGTAAAAVQAPKAARSGATMNNAGPAKTSPHAARAKTKECAQ